MNNKVINIKTDGGLSRQAISITGFVLDGSDYNMYCIDRNDGEGRDNIHASKLVKNSDGTYAMRDIVDAGEKLNVSNVVKSLITTAYKDKDAGTYGKDTITLDGREIKLFPVSIPTEQVVSADDSYVTTVKKEVSQPTVKYFELGGTTDNNLFTEEKPAVEEVAKDTGIPVINEEELPKVVPALEKAPAPEAEMPTLEPTPAEEPSTIPVVDLPEGLLLQPEVTTPEPAPAPVEAAPVVNPEPVVAPVENVTIPQPVEPNAPVVEPTAPEIKPVEFNTVSNAEFIAPQPAPTENILEPLQANPEPLKVETPVVNPQPAVATPEPTPVVPTPEPAPVANDTLVLDGSHESNLNSVLGEMSQAIPVSDIEAVKEFGVDEPAANVAPAPVADTTNATDGTTSTGKAGFANSKFFMFIALAFFFASCVFLGYEVFNYFQMVK